MIFGAFGISCSLAQQNAYRWCYRGLDLFTAALHATHAGIWIAGRDGEVREAIAARRSAAADTPLIMLNAPLVGQRLGYPDLSGLDLLELFAFVHPARFVVPTPKGWPTRSGSNRRRASDGAVPLQRDRRRLLATLATTGRARRRLDVARSRCAAALALGAADRRRAASPSAARVAVLAPPRMGGSARAAAAAQVGDRPADARARARRLTGTAPRGARASALWPGGGRVFAPRAKRAPHILLAQAGTGIGKTLGYLAPASLWAEKSRGTVWVSTYTKNLQRQLDREGAAAVARRRASAREVVVRKGRENYLCLLNLEDALQGGFGGRAAILAQLVARWAAYSQDGDMIGGDLPGWLHAVPRAGAPR